MRLSLFVVDFHLEESALEGDPAERLPSLPALDALLRHARRLPTHGDWRAALLAEVGVPCETPPAPARVAAHLLELAPDARPWIAQPVHRVAGLSSVSLHPAGLLRLSDAEAAGWCADFNRDFAASGLHLHALPSGLLLTGLPPGARGGADPAQFLGAPLPVSVPADGATDPNAERALRRASSEIEMWLHEHPRNRQRERRGELAVNGLWLWGGCGNDLPPALPRLPEAFGTDPYLRGAWQAWGGAASGARCLADLPAASTNVIVVRSAAMESPQDAPMHRLEQDWFVPLRDAQSSRQQLPLHIWFGGRGWEIFPSTLFGRFLRRPRPWWQQVAA